MKRKTKTKTVKSKTFTLANTFTAKAKPLETKDDDEIIAEALQDYKISEKEKELLAKELDKPYGQRNKALLRKFESRVDEVIDGWPDIQKSRYSIIATAPDDPEILPEQRPEPWYISLKHNTLGSDIEYRFPVSFYTEHQGVKLFKLDSTDTVVDADGLVQEEFSKTITPYIILKRYQDGDKVYAADFSLGSNAFYFDFVGFRVKAKRIGARVVPSTTKQVKTYRQKLNHFEDKAKIFDSKGNKLSQKYLEALWLKLKNEGGNIGTVKPIDPDKVVLQGAVMASGSKNSWLVFDEKIDGDIYCDYIEGVSNLQAYLTRFTGFKKAKYKTAEELNAFVSRVNQAVLDDGDESDDSE